MHPLRCLSPLEHHLQPAGNRARHGQTEGTHKKGSTYFITNSGELKHVSLSKRNKLVVVSDAP
jgi:hypothetical protein